MGWVRLQLLVLGGEVSPLTAMYPGPNVRNDDHRLQYDITYLCKRLSSLRTFGPGYETTETPPRYGLGARGQAKPRLFLYISGFPSSSAEMDNQVDTDSPCCYQCHAAFTIRWQVNVHALVHVLPPHTHTRQITCEDTRI